MSILKKRFFNFRPKNLRIRKTKQYTFYRRSIYFHKGVVHLKANIEDRACELAEYIINNKATVRAAAKKFGISKSTVHKDLAERLKNYNMTLYTQVKDILEQNKAERHIRGGEATKRKYSSTG